MSSNIGQCANEARGLPVSHTPGPASYCNICDCYYCDVCWTLQSAHYFKTESPAGVPHEKTDPTTAAIVKDTFQVSTSDDQQRELHIKDEDTTWFGVIEVEGETRFRDYRRYSELIARDQRCYPALVAFVGPTGMRFCCDILCLPFANPVLEITGGQVPARAASSSFSSRYVHQYIEVTTIISRLRH